MFFFNQKSSTTHCAEHILITSFFCLSYRSTSEVYGPFEVLKLGPDWVGIINWINTPKELLLWNYNSVAHRKIRYKGFLLPLVAKAGPCARFRWKKCARKFLRTSVEHAKNIFFRCSRNLNSRKWDLHFLFLHSKEKDAFLTFEVSPV